MSSGDVGVEGAVESVGDSIESFAAMSDIVVGPEVAIGGGGAGSFFSRDKRFDGEVGWEPGSGAVTGAGAGVGSGTWAGAATTAAGRNKSSRLLLRLRAAGLCGLGARPAVEGLDPSEPLRSRSESISRLWSLLRGGSVGIERGASLGPPPIGGLRRSGGGSTPTVGMPFCA